MREWQSMELRESLPSVLADLDAASCSCVDTQVTEWVLIARRSDGLRVYGSDDAHTPGLLADAEASCRLG